MRFRDKNGPTLYPILKPPDLPDFLAVARNFAGRSQEDGDDRSDSKVHGRIF